MQQQARRLPLAEKSKQAETKTGMPAVPAYLFFTAPAIYKISFYCIL